MERMTIKNPKGGTYRIPIEKVESFTLESLGLNIAFRGCIIDRLGRYEDLGLEPEEIEQIIKAKEGVAVNYSTRKRHAKRGSE